jgi:hypothetical protein
MGRSGCLSLQPDPEEGVLQVRRTRAERRDRQFPGTESGVSDNGKPVENAGTQSHGATADEGRPRSPGRRRREQDYESRNRWPPRDGTAHTRIFRGFLEI